MRCNSCNKFVGYDEPEVEEDQGAAEVTAEVSEDKTTVTFAVAGCVNVSLNCAECGERLKESSIEFEHTTDPVKLPEGFTYVEDSACWTDNGADGMSRTEGKGRGTKTFYGFELEGTIDYQITQLDLPKDAEPLNVSITDDVQASHMDECQ